MSPRRQLPQPRLRDEIADDLHNVRQLIQLADEQIAKGKQDLAVARAGLADLEHELRSGVRP